MRDLVLTAFIFGTVPYILRNPFVGLLMWIWLGIMNPHRLTFGFAYDMPFAMIIAVCTMISVLVNRNKVYRFPLDRVSVLLVLFVLWLGVSPLFSFHPDQEFEKWLKPIKIQIMVLLSIMLVSKREHLHKLTWVLALSIGFFGIKGGVFTILHGGQFRVWGPDGSFIGDNNTLALAVIMVVPLFRYLQLQSNNSWVKRGCFAAMCLCIVSAIGSQSRGAFLALAAIGLFMSIKSKQKVLIAVLMLNVLPIAWWIMPESWSNRMSTVQTYEEDASAMGRINAWWMAWNLAVDRFPIGGGFTITEPDVFGRYAPDPTDLHVAHSIYFQILGQHGFAGLALFLLVFTLAWQNGGWVLRKTKGRPELDWARDLAAMSQVSLVGYAVGGAFLNLTYFDLPYYIVVTLIVLRGLVKHELEAPMPSAQVVSA